MTALLKGLLSSAGGFLGGIQSYLIVGGVAMAIGAAGGAYAGYRWESGALANLKLADAAAQVAAVQAQANSDKRQAAVNLEAAVTEAQAQAIIVNVNLNTQLRIPAYVTPAQDARTTAACGISVGFYRIVRAAEGGVTPDALQLAAGQSDDDCADIPASALAGGVAQAIGTGIQNSEQLNALIAEVKANHEAQR